MKKNSWTAWAINNCVVMICFTATAIFFRKWWIILLAIISLPGMKTETGARRICDRCGRIIDLDAEARRAGWIRRKNGDSWEDFCPECQRESENPWKELHLRESEKGGM